MIDDDFKKSSMSHLPPWSPLCVEVKRTTTNVLVRDSKDRDGTLLTFTRDEWHAFVAGVKNREFDL